MKYYAYGLLCRQLLVTLVERAGFLVEEDVNNMMTDMSKEVVITKV